MQSKLKLTFLGIVIILLMSVIFLSFYKRQIMSMVYSYRYHEEVEFIKKYFYVLSEEKESEVKRRTTPEAYFLKSPSYLLQCSKLLKKVDIESMNLSSISRKEEYDEELFFIDVYFENSQNLSINLILKYQGNKWLVKSMMFSDTWD